MGATPTFFMLKAIPVWILVMLPTLITLVTRDYTINIILLTVLFPIMLAFLINMAGSPLAVKTSVIGLSSAITFFVLYIISSIFPKIKEALTNPGSNQTTTITLIVTIAVVYAIAMGISGNFIPMANFVPANGSGMGGALPVNGGGYNTKPY
jgi:hypothetical protein